MSRSLRGVLPSYALLYLGFLYAPVLLLPLFSFNDSLYMAFPLKGLTFRSYEYLAGNQDLQDAFIASCQVAGSVAVVSTVLGLLAAKAVSRRDLPGGRALAGLLVVPLVFPPLLMAMSLLFFLRRVLNVELSLITVSIGHVLITIPLAFLIFLARFDGLDKSLEEASVDLGDNAWQSFWGVTVPLVWPAIVSSMLLCFSASFDEYILASMLGGDRVTLPLFIFSQLRFPQLLPGVLALASCILAGSIALVVISEIIRRRQPGRTDSFGVLKNDQ